MKTTMVWFVLSFYINNIYGGNMLIMIANLWLLLIFIIFLLYFNSRTKDEIEKKRVKKFFITGSLLVLTISLLHITPIYILVNKNKILGAIVSLISVFSFIWLPIMLYSFKIKTNDQAKKKLVKNVFWGSFIFILLLYIFAIFSFANSNM